MSFAKPIWVLLAVALVPVTVWAAAPPISGVSRWATFQNAESHFFALSVHADPRGDYPLAREHEIVVLFDTSATQTGQVRIDALEVLDELARSVATASRLSLLACDVDTVPMTNGLVSSSDAKWETGLARLHARIPLGTTDLGKALKTAASEFSPSPAQRTIVYIGDGVNRTNFLSGEAQRELVNELVEAKITVSSLAIGPFVDLATLAALSNHTGGILLTHSEIAESPQAIGRFLGQSTATPVVWIEDAELPNSLASHFPQRFPPLRIDRDTVVVGESASAAAVGELRLSGICAGQPVEFACQVEPEASHPDMGFLVAVTELARKDGGLTLPALGSEGLRAMSYMLADSATAMVKSGQFALKAGQVESAIRIAEQALKSDPNNAEAISLLNAANQVAGPEVPAGKFMQFGGQDATAGSTVLEETLNAGDLLAEEEALRRASAQALKADVDQQLSNAQKLADKDPTGVKNSLKLLLEELDNTVSIDASLRAQLQERVRSAVQVVAAKEARYLDKIQRSETIRSQADQAERLLAETNRREESLRLLVEQFNFLMSQGEYLAAAKDVAPEVSSLAPDTPLDFITREESSLASNQALLIDAFERREQGFVDAMRGVEEAAVPFDGIPPLLYPPAEVWQALTARRKERYGSINLAGANDSEQRIYSALKQEIEVNYPGTPLTNAMTTLGDELNIPIWINTTELEAIGVDADTPVVLDLPAVVSLRSALRLMLEPLELTYIVRNEVLEITSTDSAELDPINKVYPVGDLVVPPTPMGGGMMGGMGGGMMGGMGGGMGGMGGGMGGMGGGMMGGMGGMGGGMMGGMGGGMFAVPADTTKSGKSSPLAMHRGSTDVDVQSWVEKFTTANDQQRAELDAQVQQLVQRKIELAAAHLEAKNVAGATGEFAKVIDLTGGLLGAGFPQPWMYQALSLSMEACDYPADEIKRVMLSGLDFQGDSTQALKLARYFAGRGMKKEALELLRDIAAIEPYRYDVYALALPLAAEAQDLGALRWTCLGVLSKAWPKQHAHLYRDAELKARTTQMRLAQEGRVVEAKAFEQAVQAASRRDIAVRVNWSGNADLDIRVQEPAGTICSLSSPMTISGGVLLGDTSGSSERATLEGFSEYYVCAEGYAGQYDIFIHRVWGDVTGGKATVEIYTDYGTPDQAVIHKQIEIGEKDAMVQVAVKNGHRAEPIADTQLASIQRNQMSAARTVLGQLGGDDSSSDPAQDYYNFRRALAAGNGRGLGFPRRNGAVGYMPVITTLPEGANMFVTGVVSADRRYVRISPSPNFSGIGEVLTFNFVSGQGGQNQGGAGGGLGGGIGGGLGGGQGGIGF